MTLSRPQAIVDPVGRGLGDPSTKTIVGRQRPFWGERTVWALPMTQSGAQRYLPNHPAKEACNFGMDFAFVVPFGVGLQAGLLEIFHNLAVPTPADGEWTKGAIEVRGRALYAPLTGGVTGTDYRLRWTAVDNQGNTWPRTALCLCAETG